MVVLHCLNLLKQLLPYIWYYLYIIFYIRGSFEQGTIFGLYEKFSKVVSERRYDNYIFFIEKHLPSFIEHWN